MNTGKKPKFNPALLKAIVGFDAEKPNSKQALVAAFVEAVADGDVEEYLKKGKQALGAFFGDKGAEQIISGIKDVVLDRLGQAPNPHSTLELPSGKRYADQRVTYHNESHDSSRRSRRRGHGHSNHAGH